MPGVCSPSRRVVSKNFTMRGMCTPPGGRELTAENAEIAEIAEIAERRDGRGAGGLPGEAHGGRTQYAPTNMVARPALLSLSSCDGARRGRSRPGRQG